MDLRLKEPPRRPTTTHPPGAPPEPPHHPRRTNAQPSPPGRPQSLNHQPGRGGKAGRRAPPSVRSVAPPRLPPAAALFLLPRRRQTLLPAPPGPPPPDSGPSPPDPGPPPQDSPSSIVVSCPARPTCGCEASSAGCAVPPSSAGGRAAPPTPADLLQTGDPILPKIGPSPSSHAWPASDPRVAVPDNLWVEGSWIRPVVILPRLLDDGSAPRPPRGVLSVPISRVTCLHRSDGRPVSSGVASDSPLPVPPPPSTTIERIQRGVGVSYGLPFPAMSSPDLHSWRVECKIPPARSTTRPSQRLACSSVWTVAHVQGLGRYGVFSSQVLLHTLGTPDGGGWL